jgi:hypothetical protein
MYVGQLRREDTERTSTRNSQIFEPVRNVTRSDRRDRDNINEDFGGIALIQVPKRRLFSAKAAARYLGIDLRTLKKVTDRGDVAVRKLGVRRVYALGDLNSYVESLPRLLPRAS